MDNKDFLIKFVSILLTASSLVFAQDQTNLPLTIEERLKLKKQKTSQKIDEVTTDDNLEKSSHKTQTSKIEKSSIKLRYCSVLPVVANYDFTERKEIRTMMINEVRTSTTCNLLDSENFFATFDKHDHNLEEYLFNDKILKTISDKIYSGSMIRTKIEKKITTTEVQMDVLQEDGVKKTFSKNIILPTTDHLLVKEVLKNWIVAFGKLRLSQNDATVIDISGEQVLIDIGSKQELTTEHNFTIIRKKFKKDLKSKEKTINDEIEVIADGYIYKVADNYAYGILNNNKDGNNNVVVGDKVQIAMLGNLTFEHDMIFKRHNPFNLRNIGRLSIEARAAQLTSNQNSVDGVLIGAGLTFELFLPKSTFLMFESNTEIADISSNSESSTSSSLNITDNDFVFAAGYTFLPTNTSTLDLYLSFVQNSTDLSSVDAAGFGKTIFKGFALGIRSEFPIYQKFHFFGNAFYTLSPDFNSDDARFGEGDDTKLFRTNIGGYYRINQKWAIKGSYEYVQKSTKSVNVDNASLKITDNLITAGVLFSF